jgi:hypothetical protein
MILPAIDSIMSNSNNSVIYRVVVPNNESMNAYSPTVSGFQFGGILAQIWSLITIWRLLVLFLVIGNLKNTALMWHVST